MLTKATARAPVFLISTGRTGTMFFSEFFARYGQDVSAYHCTPGTRRVHVLANAYELGLLSEAAMRRIWKAMRADHISRSPGRHVECNMYYYNLGNVILATFPNAKFVFVVRSPKGFIQSYIKWERYQWKSFLAGKMLPLWQPISYLDQLNGWLGDYHQRVDYYARIWARKNASIEAHVADPEAIRTIRFEDVFNRDEGFEILRDLLAWLDIPVAEPIGPEAVKARVNTSGKEGDDLWDEKCQEIVRRHCQPLMAAYGYAE